MSFSKLPPEVHDYILDFLHDDIFSLKTCCLTCRGWLATSQYHIFYRVSLPAPYFCMAFGHLLQQYPRIGGLVREYSISSVSTRISPGFEQLSKPGDEEAEISPDTFACLTSVKRVEISVLTVDTALQTNLVQNFQTVTNLTLQYCHFPNFGDLVQLVRSFPALETLIIRGVTWDQNADHIPLPTEAHASTLRQLSLGRDLNVSTIVEWILADGIHNNLESFSACCCSEKDATTYGALVQALGPSLHHCELDWYSSKPNDVLTLPNEFTLAHCTSIETLSLRCPVFYDQSLPWVTSLLSQIETISIETVILEIRLLGDLDAIDWELMGKVLARGSFRNLKTVVFKILVWPIATMWSEDVEASVRSRLPHLDSKGMIQFI